MTFETYFELGQHKSQAHYNPKKKQILLPSCSTAIAIPQIKLETPSTTVPNLKTEPSIEQGFGQDSMECVSNAIGKLKIVWIRSLHPQRKFKLWAESWL